MAGNLQPLVNNQRIVKDDGTPTDYFIRWAQQKQIDIGQGITAEQALEIITQYLADHELQEGSGISISPSGNLSDTPTIAAEVQAILDQITNVHGSVLFRGAAGWEALAPGTNGYFLKTNGAGADPEWAVGGGGGGGGGGGAWSLIDSWDFAVSGAITERIVDISGYTDVLIIFDSVTTSSSTWRVAQFSLDGGATYISSTVYRSLSSTGTVTNTDSALFTHATASAAARSTVAYIKGTNVDGAPKEYETARDSGVGVFGDSATATLGAITHVRLFPRDGGTITFNGGRIYVIGRPKGSGGGGGQPWWFNPPKATDFTQATGASHGWASLTDDPDEGLLFDAGTPVTGDDSIYAYQAIPSPSADWTATMRLSVVIPVTNYSAFGILCQYSGNSRIETLSVANGASSLIIKQLSLNPSSFDSERVLGYVNDINWLRISKSGTDLNFYISKDGKSWVLHSTRAISTWLTADPDRIGFGVLYNRASGTNVAGAIQHWSVA